MLIPMSSAVQRVTYFTSASLSRCSNYRRANRQRGHRTTHRLNLVACRQCNQPPDQRCIRQCSPRGGLPFALLHNQRGNLPYNPHCNHHNNLRGNQPPDHQHHNLHPCHHRTTRSPLTSGSPPAVAACGHRGITGTVILHPRVRIVPL